MARTEQLRLTLGDLTDANGVITFPVSVEARIAHFTREARRGPGQARMARRIALLRLTRG